jgi:hypothetical protein
VGHISDTWKKATVKPLIKKRGLEREFSNYRPVSNLSFVSKIVEKAMLSQFFEHDETNNLLPTYQSAYRSGFITETLFKYTQSSIPRLI